VTLTRLLLAWLPVTVAFVVFGALSARSTAPPGRVTAGDVLWWALEAGLVTLFASLWFDSLGHGGWWLLFLLVGLMVACARFPGAPRATLARRDTLVQTVRDVARYVLAGAILAWRLR